MSSPPRAASPPSPAPIDADYDDCDSNIDAGESVLEVDTDAPGTATVVVSAGATAAAAADPVGAEAEAAEAEAEAEDKAGSKIETEKPFIVLSDADAANADAATTDDSTSTAAAAGDYSDAILDMDTDSLVATAAAANNSESTANDATDPASATAPAPVAAVGADSAVSDEEAARLLRRAEFEKAKAARAAEARATIRSLMEGAAEQMKGVVDKMRGAAPISGADSSSSDSDADADADGNDGDASAKKEKKVKPPKRVVSDKYPPFAQYVTPRAEDPTQCVAGGPLWTAVTPDNHVILLLTSDNNNNNGSDDNNTASASAGAAPEPRQRVEPLSRVGFSLTARYYPPYTSADTLAPPPLSADAATEFVSSGADEVDIMLGHAQSARGLEVALSALHVGDSALIRCSPSYGFPATKKPEEVPPAAPLEFAVTVGRCEKEPNAHELDPRGRLTWAESRRAVGQTLFQQGKFQAALRQYQRALTVLENQDLRARHPAEHKRLASLFLVNQAVVNAKMGAHATVAALCSDAIDNLGDTGNGKARALRGVALAALSRFEEAEADLKLAVSLLQGAAERGVDAAARAKAGKQAATAAAELARVRAAAAAADRKLLAKVTAQRGSATGFAAGGPLDLYADKPDKAPVDPLRGKTVADLKAKSSCHGLWNVCKFVGALAWQRTREWAAGLCGQQGEGRGRGPRAAADAGASTAVGAAGNAGLKAAKGRKSE